MSPVPNDGADSEEAHRHEPGDERRNASVHATVQVPAAVARVGCSRALRRHARCPGRPLPLARSRDAARRRLAALSLERIALQEVADPPGAGTAHDPATSPASQRSDYEEAALR